MVTVKSAPRIYCDTAGVPWQVRGTKDEQPGPGAKGKLILCATPIGNLEDITLRVLRTLREADLIAAEDTRNSIRLLNHFDIHTPMTSYHEYNKIEKGRQLLEKMKEGCTVALITDAGTPGISDPGEDLVRMCREEGIEVTSLPGACALITGLTLSGQPTRRFAFEAFLPMDKKTRAQILHELAGETRTIVLYEAPHRLVKTMQELKDTLGNRPATLCRELTKIHEEAWMTDLDHLVNKYSSEKPLGECVLVIRGKPADEVEKEAQARWESLSLQEHVSFYENEGLSHKDAMRQAASDRGLSRRDVYQALLAQKE